MDGSHSDAALSTPVTISRKGVVSPPRDQLDEARFKDSLIAGDPAGRIVSDTKRLSVVASRSLSSGSSSSESNSVLSTESSSSSMAATDATSQEDVSEDEKSSGHTVVRTDSKVDSGALQLAGEQDAPTGHVQPSSPALTRTSSQDSGAAEVSEVNKARREGDLTRFDSSHSTLYIRCTSSTFTQSPASLYYSQLPVSAPQQHLANRQQGRTRPTRHNTHTAGAASASVALLERDQSSRPRPVPGGGHAEHARSHSMSPRHTLSRSYTTSAVSSMGAPAHLLTNNSSTSSNLPQPFPGTSSIAPPVQNSASVTFAPPPTTSRTRAYSTSASGLASPTSPALESMASLNLEAMRLSPPGSSSASSSGSPPTAPLASSHALMGATSSPPPASTANWKSSPRGYDGRGEAFPAATSSSSGSAMPLSSPHPSFNSSAANRRHSVDPYSQRNNNNTNNNNIINLNNTTPPSGAFGHRRHHQSISVPPSSGEYSSLGDHQVQNHQASHLHHLSSRYRKSSLGSQALLSPTALEHMTSPTSALHTSSQGGSSGRAQQWDHHAHRSHHALGDPGGGPQLSPTRSRNDQYLSTSPRYSSRASHEAQRNNQLEAKIVLLGRQGVGKTVCFELLSGPAELG